MQGRERGKTEEGESLCRKQKKEKRKKKEKRAKQRMKEKTILIKKFKGHVLKGWLTQTHGAFELSTPLNNIEGLEASILLSIESMSPFPT